uniref:U3 small nucleolar RNA-interacting protein 2 n=1 Tax=Cacopsylla melanoneura TaxID=428564 RepID=A0A8D8V4Z4_9HEMI
MSFFIRNKKQINTKSRKRKITEKPTKAKKPTKADLEELTSDEDDDDNNNIGFETQDFEDGSDVEEDLTEQERKVQLAKKYLEEIELVEKEKLNDIKDNHVLKKLELVVLEQDGKLRVNIADELENASVTCSKFSGKPHRSSITCIAVTSDSKHVYSACKNGIIIKWLLETKSKVCSRTGKKSYPSILTLAVSPDNRVVASGDAQCNIQLWSPCLEIQHTFSGHKAAVTGLAFSFECDTLFSSSNDRSIKVWNIEDYAYVETLFGHQSSITSLDILSKNRVISSGGTDKSIRVWKIQEESQLVFNGHSRGIDMVKRVNDQQFVSCGEDGTLSLWSILKKVPTHTIPVAHGYDSSSTEPNWITSVACLPNSDLVASGSYDGSVKLWKITPKRTFEFLLNIPLPGVINSLVFTCDQKHLIAGIGTEHKFGRWKTIKGAKNTVAIIDIALKPK